MTLYNITSIPIYSYILAIVKNTHIAEDLVQETYVSIRKNITKYKPMKKPMAWIFTIARNNTFTYFSKHKENIEYNDKNLYIIDSFSMEKNSIENIVLQAALETLNENERLIVVLNIVNGYKFREIAKYLNISIGTVLSKYHRAMFKLKKVLKEEIE